MSPATTPRWLHAYATTTGDDPTLAGTRAVPRWCRDCRHLVLAGYDSPLIATLAICDPHPLTAQLEAAAVILARPTWRLWGAPGRYELTPRTPAWTASTRLAPAGPDVLVLASHHCGRPPLTREPLPVPAGMVYDTAGDPPF